ncbi:DUF5689 domain-containing protein [Rufibacter sediminis]|uniref:DUF5689 domain-containing protein n=1 Tax=Rufibacter sediminis TaxID=2762756 RepID=A0ABR6VQM4_9BACT|nr:DUF5689 domain-containing protein [Rufibacter sediminis]MBC3538881.1 hypothetical protein [Rufibacter sediminis]
MENKIFQLFAFILGALALSSCLEEDENNAIGQPSPYMSVADVRALYRGEDVQLTTDKMGGAHQVVGVVISDPASGNFPTGQVVIQNSRRRLTRGVILDFGSTTAPFVMGDSIVVNTEGATLTSINGALQIKGLSLAGVTKAKSGIEVTPRVVNLEALTTKPGDYEGTLVRIVAGNATPTPGRSAKYSGDKKLTDGNGNNIILHTDPNASFANERLWASATYTGVPLMGMDPQTQEPTITLRLRSINDVMDASGPIYLGFPESFENPSVDKPSYNMVNGDRGVWDNTIDFTTGSWKLYNSILGPTSNRDRFTGKQGIRMNQNLAAASSPYTQMNFDVPDGASKVTYIYGAYYTDASSTWWIEYSQDQGQTWTQIGPTMTEAGNWTKTATILMDISGPVRFRLFKKGLGPTSLPAIANGRFSFDDFAIYSNAD